MQELWYKVGFPQDFKGKPRRADKEPCEGSAESF